MPFRPNAIDMKGQRFGMLTVVERNNDDDLKKKKSEAHWICECDCGRTTSVPRSNLIRGKVKSCGCLRAKFLMNPDGSFALDSEGNRITKQAQAKALGLNASTISFRIKNLGWSAERAMTEPPRTKNRPGQQ